MGMLSTELLSLLPMPEKLQRPLMLGGLAFGSIVLMLELLNQTLGEWSVYTSLALAISYGVWWLQQKSEQKIEAPVFPQVADSTTVKRVLAEAEQVITRLKLEVDDSNPALAAIQPQIEGLQSQVRQVEAELDRESLRLMVMGGKGSGKTTLIQRLQTDWTAPAGMTFYEAPSFSAVSEAGLTAEAVALKQAIAADLVLFLVTGDLTASELRMVQQLTARKRTLLVFNKQDVYLPEERQVLLSRMQEWGRGVIAATDVVAIATAPKPFKVRQYQADGTAQEWMETQNPEIAVLTQRLDAIVQAEGRQLVLASSLGNATELKTQAATILNNARRVRALPVIEKFQWITAGTAFASPVPTLDVVATAAINVQMILDLGAIYQQQFSLEQAQKAVTTLGSLILKLGLVELSTRTVSSLLKTNAITYIAGGCIQAVSAAYLTRITGLALIEYFQTQEPNLTLTAAKPLASDRFSQILQQVFQQNQQLGLLQTLAAQVMDRLAPKPAVAPPTPAPVSSPAQLAAATTGPLSLPQPDSVLDHHELRINSSATLENASNVEMSIN